MHTVISDIFGFIAIASTFVVFIQKEQKQLIFAKMFVNILWLIYFFLRSYWGLSETYSACVIQLVAVLRGVVALNVHRKWASGQIWLWCFIALSWLGSLATWQGAACWLSAISSTCATIMFWCKTPQQSRFWGIATYVTWGVYAWLTNSYMALASSIIAMISIAVGFLKYKKAEK